MGVVDSTVTCGASVSGEVGTLGAFHRPTLGRCHPQVVRRIGWATTATHPPRDATGQQAERERAEESSKCYPNRKLNDRHGRPGYPTGRTAVM